MLPLAAATLTFLLRRGAVAVSLATALGITASVAVLVLEVFRRGPLTHTVGGWDAPLGIELYADGLTAVMLIMAALVGVAITVYAAGYFSDSPAKARYFWPLPPVPLVGPERHLPLGRHLQSLRRAGVDGALGRRLVDVGG